MTKDAAQVVEKLQACGLDESEARVVLLLLEQQPNGAAEIAGALRMKRPTVYAALERLASRGMVSKIRSGRRFVFSTVPAELLPAALEGDARRKFEAIHHVSRELLPLLHESLAHTRYLLGAFSVSRIDSVDSVYKLLGRTLQSGSFVSIFNPQLCLTNARGRALVVDFLKSCAGTKPPIREIAVAGPETNWYRDHIRNTNHELRELPSDSRLFSDIILTKDSLLVTNYLEDQACALLINEKFLSVSLKTVFELLWRSLAPA